MLVCTYKPIGVVHSPFAHTRDAPRQPDGAAGTSAQIEIFPEFAEGLMDLERYEEIILLCHLHLSHDVALQVRPPGTQKPRGVFASRASRRPNPIGISRVKLRRIENNFLHIENIDFVDGTPVLDLKPCYPSLDAGV